MKSIIEFGRILSLGLCLVFAAIPAAAEEAEAFDSGESPSNGEKIEQLQKKVDVVDEDLYQRYRLMERRLNELEDKVSEDMAKKQYKTAWAERIKLSGDLRLRYQADLFSSDNAEFVEPEDPSELMNTTEDRQRYRYRARIGLKAKVIDPRSINANVGKAEIGLRLATGSEDNPVSTNQTMGDAFNKDRLLFDRAYLQYSFSPIEEFMWAIPAFSLTGGRMPNPWFYTNLVWDDDLNFEGAALSYTTDSLASEPFSVFLTGGLFSLEEVKFSDKDKWMWGAQMGFNLRPSSSFNFKIAGAYYDYLNITGEANDPARPNAKDYTAPAFQQKGNSLMDIDTTEDVKTALAAEFKIVNVTAKLTLDFFFPTQIVLWGDYALNIGFDKDDVAERTGNVLVKEENQGYQYGLLLGYPKISEFGQWNISGYYRYLEADAVLDAFTDSDFHGGGTNCQGWVAGFGVGLFKNIWLSAKWMTADEIEGPTMAWDTVQVDINARF